MELAAEFFEARGDALFGLCGLVVLWEVEARERGEQAIDLGVLDDESSEVAGDDTSEAAEQRLDL